MDRVTPQIVEKREENKAQADAWDNAMALAGLAVVVAALAVLFVGPLLGK